MFALGGAVYVLMSVRTPHAVLAARSIASSIADSDRNRWRLGDRRTDGQVWVLRSSQPGPWGNSPTYDRPGCRCPSVAPWRRLSMAQRIDPALSSAKARNPHILIASTANDRPRASQRSLSGCTARCTSPRLRSRSGRLRVLSGPGRPTHSRASGEGGRCSTPQAARLATISQRRRCIATSERR